MTFHQLVKRLHPDAIGDNSKVDEFMELMEHRRNECLCGCGRQRPYRNRQFYNSICRLRYLHPQLKALAVVVLAIACLGAGAPPMPPVKKKVQALHSPRGAELYSAVTMAIAIPPRQLYLWWNHPMPMPNQSLEFDIEHRESFSAPWVRIGRTNQPPFPIAATGAAGMWRVGAHWR